MKMKRWFLAAAAVLFAIAMAGCPVSTDPAPTPTPPPTVPPPGGDVFWSFATDSHFQGLAIDETDPEVIFGDDDTNLPLGQRALEDGGEFEVRVINSPIADQARSLLITADIPLGDCWGAGLALFVDEIVAGDHGFQVGDRITVIGEVLQIGNTVTSWWPVLEAVPGGAVTLSTTGFYEEPYNNPLNVDPIVLASRNSVGVIEFTVTLTQAHVNNINQAVAPPRPADDGRALAIGMAVLGQNRIRIDNIIFERGDGIPIPTPPEPSLGGLIIGDEPVEFVLVTGTFDDGYMVTDTQFDEGVPPDGAYVEVLGIELAEPAYIGDLSYITVNLRSQAGWDGGSFAIRLTFDDEQIVVVATDWVAGSPFDYFTLGLGERPGWATSPEVGDTTGYLVSLTLTVGGEAMGRDIVSIVFSEGVPEPTPPPAPEAVTVYPSAPTVTQGQTQQFTATVLPAGAPLGVTWSVEPETAGTITQAAGTTLGGLLTLTGAAAGDTVTVRATATDTAIYGEATVTVRPAPDSVEVYPPTAEVMQGMTRQFTADVLPAGALQAVTWSVEPETAGTITQTEGTTPGGLLTLAGTAEGTVTVRATATGTAIYGEATVTVTLPTDLPASVEVLPATMNVEWRQTHQFTANVTPPTAPQGITWSVYPATAGTITQTVGTTPGGLLTLTGAAVGDTVTVRATATGTAIYGEATVTVTAVPQNAVLSIDVVGQAGNGVPRKAIVAPGSREFAAVTNGNLAIQREAWPIGVEEAYFYIDFAEPLLLNGFYAFDMDWSADGGIWFGITLLFDDDEVSEEASSWHDGPVGAFAGNFDLRGATAPIVGMRINRGDDDSGTVTISNMVFAWREPPAETTITVGGQVVSGMLVVGTLDGDYIRPVDGSIDIWLHEPVYIGNLSSVTVSMTEGVPTGWVQINLRFGDTTVTLAGGAWNINPFTFSYPAQWQGDWSAALDTTDGYLTGFEIGAGLNDNVPVTSITIALD